MEIPDHLSNGEAKAIARVLFSTSTDVHYLTKKGFEDIAIQVDPKHTPTISGDSREYYLYEILTELPFKFVIQFVGETIAIFRKECSQSYFDEDEIIARNKRVNATVSRINRVLHPYGITIGQDGKVSSVQGLEELTMVQADVYDGLGRWQLDDVRKLLENAEDHYHEGRSNSLRYDDCASNAAKALEGVLRKALVEAHLAKGNPDPTPKLKTMMANAIKELDKLVFWSDPIIRLAADNYRKFLRNRAQHYNTETLDIKFVGFDRIIASFAFWEALTLIGTIIETLDEL